MAKQITEYKIFLASPGDTANERAVVEKIISEIDRTLGDHHRFRLKLLKWETDTYPDFGEDGQDVINRQIGMDYDIFIGIMWKRFGTKTNRAESGTQEEFQRAHKEFEEKGFPKIMFYFNSAPLPQDSDMSQFELVKNFKATLGEQGGYYFTYNSEQQFVDLLRPHLTKMLLNMKPAKTILEQEAEAPIGTHKIDKPASMQQSAVVPEINTEFEEYLNDMEANFAHSTKDEILLEDLYIPPDLRNMDQSKNKHTYDVINLDGLTDAIDIAGIRFALLGNESAGKTAACKYLFKKYFNMGLLPVLVKGTDINKNIRAEAVRKIVEGKIAEQYQVAFSLDSVHKDRLLIIIDDFQKAAKGNNKYWATLVKNIITEFNNVVITGNTLMPVEGAIKESAFEAFSLYALLEFGPKFRKEIAERWYLLGIDERFVDPNEQRRKVDNALAHIKTIIGKNYIPSYPFFILSILQAMESGSVQNPNYSIHGFYYELIINESLNRAVKDKKEISLYYNYLTMFAYFLFEENKKELTVDQFKEFHRLYCKRHDLTYSYEAIVRVFDAAKILHVNRKVYIKDNFVYFFFVAKHIANNISKQATKDLVTKMSIRIFKDEYASIIMFVTHLSKDEFIIKELIKNANTIFRDVQPVRLEEDIKGINELITTLPKQILEMVDVEQKRQEEIDHQENEERLQKEKEFDDEMKNYDDFKLDDDISAIDYYARLTLAFKTIDILGQITKKHWGEIDGEQKLELVAATYNLGLRTLGTYLQQLQMNSKEIIAHVKEIVTEKHIKDRFELKEKIEELARDFIFNLSFLTAWGTTKRVAIAIGYDKLKNTFEKMLAEQPTNSVKLIDLCIKLAYAGIPFDEVEEYKRQMEKNNLSYCILKNLVIDHMYMFDTDYKEKAQICSMLGIDIKKQLKIDSTSKIKK